MRRQGENLHISVLSAIKKVANDTGTDFLYMCKLADIESKFDPNARNKRSSARGLYQIIRSTERSIRRKHNIKGSIYNPRVNALMVASLIKEYSPMKSYTGLYLMHFLGKRTYMTLADAHDSELVRNIIPKAYGANKGLIGNKTKKQFIKHIDELMDKARGCE